MYVSPHVKLMGRALTNCTDKYRAIERINCNLKHSETRLSPRGLIKLFWLQEERNKQDCFPLIHQWSCIYSEQAPSDGRMLQRTQGLTNQQLIEVKGIKSNTKLN